MKSIRALERGLEVLRLLEQHQGRALQDLHLATALPKPTLLRILHTLEAAGLAWRAQVRSTSRSQPQLIRAARDRPGPPLVQNPSPAGTCEPAQGVRVTLTWPQRLAVPITQ